MKQQEFNPNQHISTTLSQYAPDFKPYFETRLMSKISQLREQNYSYIFNRTFQRLILSSVTVLAILLMTIFISDGSFSTDALMGTNNLNFENITAMIITGF